AREPRRRARRAAARGRRRARRRVRRPRRRARRDVRAARPRAARRAGAPLALGPVGAPARERRLRRVARRAEGGRLRDLRRPRPRGAGDLRRLLPRRARAGRAARLRRGARARALRRGGRRMNVNGRDYARPRGRNAVVCLDGVDPRYFEDALARRLVPRIAELPVHAEGRSQLPSFTNPNNLSIVTGAAPAVHGLPGNHCLGPDGAEVQLVDPRFLRAPSIHAAVAADGVSVLAVTTKDKLRALLGAGGVPCVSAERAHELSLPGVPSLVELVGRPNPGIYDWDCSHYALELG